MLRSRSEAEAETGSDSTRLRSRRMGCLRPDPREASRAPSKQIVDRFDEIVRVADAPEQRSRPVDVETLDALEELLISADVGVAATDRIIAAVKAQSRNGASLRDLVKQEIRAVFAAVDRRSPSATVRRSR